MKNNIKIFAFTQKVLSNEIKLTAYEESSYSRKTRTFSLW